MRFKCLVCEHRSVSRSVGRSPVGRSVGSATPYSLLQGYIYIRIQLERATQCVRARPLCESVASVVVRTAVSCRHVGQGCLGGGALLTTRVGACWLCAVPCLLRFACGSARSVSCWPWPDRDDVMRACSSAVVCLLCSCSLSSWLPAVLCLWFCAFCVFLSSLHCHYGIRACCSCCILCPSLRAVPFHSVCHRRGCATCFARRSTTSCGICASTRTTSPRRPCQACGVPTMMASVMRRLQVSALCCLHPTRTAPDTCKAISWCVLFLHVTAPAPPFLQLDPLTAAACFASGFPRHCAHTRPPALLFGRRTRRRTRTEHRLRVV